MKTTNNNDILFDDVQMLGERQENDFAKSADTDCTSYVDADDERNLCRK